MPICIYCKLTKPSSSFNSEHVLQNSFGTYKNALTLIDKVCMDCNSQFGESIDRILARTTIEGNKRFLLGVCDPKNFKQNHVNGLHFVVAEGDLKGLKVIPVFSMTDSKIIITPLYDVGFRGADGVYDFFNINALPEKEKADKIYPAHSDRIMILPHRDSYPIRRAIQQKWDLANLPFCSIYKPAPDYAVEIRGTITPSHKQALAKSAFNYLAKHNATTVLLQSCFDPIRNFILHGTEPNWDVCKVEKAPIVYEQYNQAAIGHVIVLYMTNDRSIIAEVSLFNYLKYTICLAKNYSGDLPVETDFGHFFNPINHEISLP